MDEFKWTLGEPCIRSSRQKPSAVVPEPKLSLSEDTTPAPSNKREIANEKINQRHLISQIGQNPFLMQNKYLDDLEIQETFLKPKNSNYGYESNE